LNCKYHIVFAPKYRRQVFCGEKKRAIGEILRKLCEWTGVHIVEAECSLATTIGFLQTLRT
jgi:putative transposase